MAIILSVPASFSAESSYTENCSYLPAGLALCVPLNSDRVRVYPGFAEHFSTLGAILVLFWMLICGRCVAPAGAHESIPLNYGRLRLCSAARPLFSRGHPMVNLCVQPVGRHRLLYRYRGKRADRRVLRKRRVEVSVENH